jgi:Uri superfamily endonuclease
MPDLASYQLIIDVPQSMRLTIGKLGTFDFPAGRYTYTGSARRGMEARLRRHLDQDKRLHWHIDYLLAGSGVRIAAVRRSRAGECMLNQRTRGTRIVLGFGASDCLSGCGSHLKWRALGSA